MPWPMNITVLEEHFWSESTCLGASVLREGPASHFRAGHWGTHFPLAQPRGLVRSCWMGGIMADEEAALPGLEGSPQSS